MIKEIFIKNYEDLMPLFSEDQYNEDIKRFRSSYLYRGMPRTSYKMTTSLARNCKDKKRFLEPSILKNFTKYASLNDPGLNESVWKQMMAGQHHGLPTRLLDFTHSPLIALHFAAVNEIEEAGDEDCVVWRIDMAEIHNLLPSRYKSLINESKTKIFSLQMLEDTASSIDQYDEDMGDHSMVIVEPSSIDERIVNQYAFFAVVPTDIEDIEGFLDKYTDNTIRYIISSDLRWRIADTLDSFNISERIMYPGLDGLSKWIARHYFVRD